MDSEPEVLERERQFHDTRFGHAKDPRDALASYYTLTTESDDYFYNEIEQAVGGRRHVLSYGCGTEIRVDFLRRLQCRFWGLDISTQAIVKARQIASDARLNAQFKVGNAELTGFDDGQFDVVYGSGILHHINIDKASRELARIIDPAGHCVFLEPLGHNPAINAFRRLTPHLRSDDEHPLRVSDFDTIHAHFRQVKVRYFHCLSLGAVALRRTPAFTPAYKALSALDRYLIDNLRGFSKQCWVCVMTLSDPVSPRRSDRAYGQTLNETP